MDEYFRGSIFHDDHLQAILHHLHHQQGSTLIPHLQVNGLVGPGRLTLNHPQLCLVPSGIAFLQLQIRDNVTKGTMIRATRKMVAKIICYLTQLQYGSYKCHLIILTVYRLGVNELVAYYVSIITV